MRNASLTALITGTIFLAFLLSGLSPALSGEETLGKLQSGKEAFESQCGLCHPLKDALNETKSRDDWEITVAMMKSNGAAFTDEQKFLIIDYLSAKSLFEMKCSVCHAIDRPRSKNKSLGDWEATVKRMSGKRAGHLSEEDVELISSYLALERPLQQ